MNPHIDTLRQRLRWLDARLNLKKNQGIDAQFDEAEINALVWAIDLLSAITSLVERHDT